MENGFYLSIMNEHLLVYIAINFDEFRHFHMFFYTQGGVRGGLAMDVLGSYFIVWVLFLGVG